MSTLWITIIIALVLGLIISNILLVKQTAKMDFKAKPKQQDDDIDKPN